ncbi:MAG: rhomboid family intramembrane serine protease [Actinomycetota bacterium]|nr:rhomboid family intramembrane serine protease [Actinomycetota bacterium]
MVAASVGFQCPECLHAGAKTVREHRTVFGGRARTDAGRITTAIIAVNVAVFLFELLHGRLDLEYGDLALSLPKGDGTVYRGVADGAYYRLLTSAFLHANVIHIAFNMLALAQVGPVLERALGPSRFVSLYLLSALGGSTLSYLISSPYQLGVGASGAIFGLFGAYYVVVRRLGGETGPIVVLLGLNLVITFSVANIDWRAHIGGLVTGAALACAFAFIPAGPRRTVWHAAAGATVAAVLVVLVVARTAALSG